MKNARQSALLSIIGRDRIQTQEDLVRRLGDLGYNVTQATVSRDIKELKITKASGEGGLSYYVAGEQPKEALPAANQSDRFIRMFINSVQGIDYSGNIIVIHTLSGTANAAAEAVDNLRWPEILGTMAGDNTIFAVARVSEDAPVIVSRLRALLKEA